MKHFAFSCAVIFLILGLALWNAHDIERDIAPLCASLEQARNDASAKDWGRVLSAVSEAAEDWHARYERMHYVIAHSQLDEADCLFARLLSLAQAQDMPGFRAEAAELIARLTDLAESQQLTLRNIL